MKKIISYIVVIALIGTIGFSIYEKISKNNMQNNIEEKLNNSNLYPFYQSLDDDEKEIYIDICTAIEKFSILELGKYKTSKEAHTIGDKYSNIFSSLIYEQPQYFWIDPSGLNCRIAEMDGNKLTIGFHRFANKEDVKEKKEELNKKVSEIVSAAKNKRNTYEKALYVYDKIMEIASYDYELYEDIEEYKDNYIENRISGELTSFDPKIAQTAYGCLIDGKTICSGYALAFNLIMQELGYECGTVKNTALGSFSFGANHVSNFCKLDGDYYYFDLTWDDTGFDSEEYKKYMDYSHQYFAITRAEFENTHVIDKEAYAPEATSNKYNYFVKNNIYFEKYDYELVKPHILSQASNGFVVLKFKDYGERYAAESELLSEQKIYSLIGKNECKYLTPKFSTLLYIFF